MAYQSGGLLQQPVRTLVAPSIFYFQKKIKNANESPGGSPKTPLKPKGLWVFSAFFQLFILKRKLLFISVCNPSVTSQSFAEHVLQIDDPLMLLDEPLVHEVIHQLLEHSTNVVVIDTNGECSGTLITSPLLFSLSLGKITKSSLKRGYNYESWQYFHPWRQLFHLHRHHSGGLQCLVHPCSQAGN